jgi:hypothetical protein
VASQAGVLRVEVAVGKELHRPLEVGEEHSYLFALTSKVALEVRMRSARCLGV